MVKLFYLKYDKCTVANEKQTKQYNRNLNLAGV